MLTGYKVAAREVHLLLQKHPFTMTEFGEEAKANDAHRGDWCFCRVERGDSGASYLLVSYSFFDVCTALHINAYC